MVNTRSTKKSSSYSKARKQDVDENCHVIQKLVKRLKMEMKEKAKLQYEIKDLRAKIQEAKEAQQVVHVDPQEAVEALLCLKTVQKAGVSEDPKAEEAEAEEQSKNKFTKEQLLAIRKKSLESGSSKEKEFIVLLKDSIRFHQMLKKNRNANAAIQHHVKLNQQKISEARHFFFHD